MHPPQVDALTQSFAIAAGTCFLVGMIALDIMRVKANARLVPERRVSWIYGWAAWKRVTSDYRRLYPEGWGYRVLQTAAILWVTFAILAVLATILGAST